MFPHMQMLMYSNVFSVFQGFGKGSLAAAIAAPFGFAGLLYIGLLVSINVRRSAPVGANSKDGTVRSKHHLDRHHGANCVFRPSHSQRMSLRDVHI